MSTIDHSKNTDLLAITAAIKKAKMEMDSSAHLPTMDEAIFKKFLPLLTASGDVDITPWMDIVGAPTVWVIVTRNGQEIYRVPPIGNTRRRTTTRHADRSESIANRMAIAKNKSARIPTMANRYIAEGLEGAVPKLTTDLEHLKQWNYVLKVNGYPPLSDDIGKVATGPGVAISSGISDDDICEYHEA